MFNIRYALKEDKAFWFTIECHICEDKFYAKVRDKQGYIICDGDKEVGILRYGLFWDNIPFVNLIELDESYRNKGFGSQAMKSWEDEMQKLGYKLVMTSSQSNELAQHFYRKLGYIDSGCLLLVNDPAEILFVKYFD